jgi:hypothetical protein
MFKSIFNIALLGWVTALAFDAKEVGIEAWDGIPSWLKSYLGGGGVVGVNEQTQRSWASNEEGPGRVVILQLQQVIKKIKAVCLTRDVWVVIRIFLVRCLRTALHYLDPPHGASPKIDPFEKGTD